jgi:hypothetical protein
VSEPADKQLAHAVKVIASVLAEGAATHPEGSPQHWQSLTVRQHLGKAFDHLARALAGLSDEDHAALAAARLMLALELRGRQRTEAGKLGRRHNY